MKTAAVAALAVSMGATSAYAASITVNTFSSSAYDDRADLIDQLAFQDFEDWNGLGGANSGGANGVNIADGTNIGVGSVSAIASTGTGGTVSGSGGFAGNDGSQLAVRDGNVFGRQSTTKSQSFGEAGDDQFLDSNDTFGITWTVSAGGSMFDAVLFTMSDATDVGATMRITVGTEVQEFSNLGGNGNQQVVQVLFDTMATMATIELFNVNGAGDGFLNDGFSLDDMLVGAQVPLPAAGWLLLGGLGGLAAMKRRRKS